MARALCGFDSSPAGSGAESLSQHGPTLLVGIGFDKTLTTRVAPERLHASIARGLEDGKAGRTVDAEQVLRTLHARSSRPRL